METENKYEESEWELINPKNLFLGLNNHDGLKWDMPISIRNDEGYIRGMPVGWIIQGDSENSMRFLSNEKDEKYVYRMIMSVTTVLFFRKKRIIK